ncbi:hypothetical protein THRCLA_20838 [Thraustotheca clavata]|uniref:MYND-type domain-containing protein n=1 Tax=Thraustotheca clavata TaxID=74557 RepID=A0A1W0A2V2_9STRA|nr:hypothetical protein THRCLA_20838 [Thraustotheca clavata]
MTCAMSTCRSTDASMRCSRCKSVFYCSHECQRSHWAMHKRSCTYMYAAMRWKTLESEWWATLPRDVHKTYGEVYFMLQGLKPCVVLTGVPNAFKQDFYDKVIQPCKLGEDVLVATINKVRTQAFDFDGKLILLHRQHERYNMILSMLKIKEIGHDDIVLEEKQIAWILDYPVALDECNDGTMLEIAYFAIETNDLLTSFCALDTIEHRQRVNVHFQKYKATLGEMLPMRIQVIIVS